MVAERSKLVNKEDAIFARDQGFFPGPEAGYGNPDLWVNSDGGTRIYPGAKPGTWVAAYFDSRGGCVPFASRVYPSFRAAIAAQRSAP